MKKTIIALMALSGVALAAGTTDVTLGSWYTEGEEDILTLDAVVGKGKADVASTLSADTIGELKNSASFTINTGDLLMSGVEVGDVVTISSIQLASGCSSTWGTGASEGRVISITLNGQSYTSDQQVATGVTGSAYGTLTYTFSGSNVFSFTVGDELGLTVNAQTSVVHQQLGTFKNQTGVSDITTPGLDAGWQAAVKLNGTVVASVPEPTTATLSLLALAGLAARRRRK